MKLAIAFFVTIIAIILIISHTGLFYAWTWLFDIQSLTVKNALMISLGVLSISFLLTTLLVHFIENSLTSLLYIISSIWLGLAWYLSLATVLSLIIAWLFSFSDFSINLAVISGILLSLGLLYTIYGIRNAQQVKLKNIQVPMANLPSPWIRKKAVLISDVHLGIFHHRGFMEKIVKKINEQTPDLVFITGDLFDGAGKRLNHLADPIKNIKATDGIFYVTGNHETYIGLDKSLIAVDRTPAKILKDELVEVDGVQILGLAYPKAGEKKDHQSILSQLDAKKPSIILYHEPRVSVVAKVKSARANLMLCGHTHLGQLWPFGGITKAVYKKGDYGLISEGNFNLYTTSGVGTWGPPMRTGNSPEIVVIKFENT